MLEQRQDPGAYLHKSFNVINFGDADRNIEYHQELPGYKIKKGFRGILRGSKVINNIIKTDFYWGPSLTYAHLATFTSTWLKATPFIIMFGAFLVAYVLLVMISKDSISSVLIVLSFLLSTPIIHFGRTSYSEGLTMLIILTILSIFTMYHKFNNNTSLLKVVFVLSLSLIFIRLDTSILLIPILILLANYKKPFQTFSLLLVVIIFYELAKYNQIYFGRISGNQIIFNYFPLVTFLIVFLYFILDYLDLGIFGRMQKHYGLLLSVLIRGGLLIFPIFIFKDDIILYVHTWNADIFIDYFNVKPGNREDINIALLGSFLPLITILICTFGTIKHLGHKKLPLSSLVLIFTLLILSAVLIDNGRNSNHLFWYSRRFIMYSVPLIIMIVGISIKYYGSSAFRPIALASLLIVSNNTIKNYPQKEYVDLYEQYLILKPILSSCETMGFKGSNMTLSPFINPHAGQLIDLNNNDVSKFGKFCDCIISTSKIEFGGDPTFSTNITYERPKMLPLGQLRMPKKTNKSTKSKIYYYEK